jgi:hypothetical protein
LGIPHLFREGKGSYFFTNNAIVDKIFSIFSPEDLQKGALMYGNLGAVMKFPIKRMS